VDRVLACLGAGHSWGLFPLGLAVPTADHRRGVAPLASAVSSLIRGHYAQPPVDEGPIGRLGERRLDSERDEAFACLSGRVPCRLLSVRVRLTMDSMRDGIRRRLEQELLTAVSQLRPLNGAVAVVRRVDSPARTARHARGAVLRAVPGPAEEGAGGQKSATRAPG
jgi:hypothetical protein